MSFVLSPHPTLGAAIHEVAAYLIDQAIADIDNPEVDRHTAVHEVRKRCKEMRALIRLVRGPLEESGRYDRENHWFRDAAREISDIRDATALLETYDLLMARFSDEIDRPRMSIIRRRLTARKKALDAETDLDGKLEAFRAKMVVARERLDDWTGAVETFAGLRYGFKKPYQRGDDAMASAYESEDSHDFHQWRKRVKYHRYHCELLEPIWPEIVGPWRAQVDLLSQWLGQEHDCAVFGEVLRDEADRFGSGEEIVVALALIERLQIDLREQCRPLGERIYCESPGSLADRFQTWFEAWRETTSTS